MIEQPTKPADPPTPDEVVAAVLPNVPAGPDRERLYDLVGRLLAQAISLDEFVIGATETPASPADAARLAAACAALPFPGAKALAGLPKSRRRRIDGPRGTNE